jgi:hypothetical protein
MGKIVTSQEHEQSLFVSDAEQDGGVCRMVPKGGH